MPGINPLADDPLTLGTAGSPSFPASPIADVNDVYPQSTNDFGMPTVLIDGYPIDCVVTESHDYSAEVTAYPVEVGADITDHRRKKPLKITLDGYVSATPIGVVANHPTRSAGKLPVDDAKAKLLAVDADGEPINITTSLDSFKNMLLENLAFPRESGEPMWLHFKATFVQVLFVTNNRTTIRTATPGGQKRSSVGDRLAQLGIPFASVFTLVQGGGPGGAEFLNTLAGVPFTPASSPILVDKVGRHFVINESSPESDGFVIGDNSIKGLSPGYHPWFGTTYDPATGLFTDKSGRIVNINSTAAGPQAAAARSDLDARILQNDPVGRSADLLNVTPADSGFQRSPVPLPSRL